MAVSSAHSRAPVMQSLPSWTNARADALRQALRMTNESCADHLGLSVRTVAYWRERPNSIPQQRTQEILDAALERASDHAKERFARLLADGPDSRQQPASRPQAATSLKTALARPRNRGRPLRSLMT